MFRALLQADILRAESACERARTKRAALIASIREIEELLEDTTMDREQVTVLKTRLLQRIIELDRFDQEVARPAEEARQSVITRLAKIMADLDVEPSAMN